MCSSQEETHGRLNLKIGWGIKLQKQCLFAQYKLPLTFIKPCTKDQYFLQAAESHNTSLLFACAGTVLYSKSLNFRSLILKFHGACSI